MDDGLSTALRKLIGTPSTSIRTPAMHPLPRTDPSASPYPPFPEGLPDEIATAGAYAVRFARSLHELEAIQKLRFEVFNLELGEGLDASYDTGRDVDEFDATCHHLMVCETKTGEIVGTYRLQTLAMAERGRGFYSDDEFDLSDLPREILSQAVEIGRACIAKKHRGLKVLYLLWCGLGMYLNKNAKRYLFGCNSLTSQDPAEGQHVLDYLMENGHMHPTLTVRPQPGYECIPEAGAMPPTAKANVPRLMRVYLSFGAKICGAPAIDRLFKTIDYFAFFDAENLDQRTLAFFRYRPDTP